MPDASRANLRFRKSSVTRDTLGQVSTPEAIAARLVERVPPHCRRIIDLGAGDGRLTRAARRVSPSAHALLIEADQERVLALAHEPPARTRVLALDVMRDAALAKAREHFGTADAVLSNPPYLEAQLAREDIQRIQAVFPWLQDEAGWVRADVAFLAHAWMLSAIGSFIGFIIPAPALTQPRFRPLREMLIVELAGLTVSQLPSRVFPGTEVDAFLVTGIRARPERRDITLRQLDLRGEVTGELRLPGEAGIERLDYRAHTTGRAGDGIPGDTLGSLDVDIVRGSLTRTAFAHVGLDAFHTTHFAAARGAVSLTAGSAAHRMAETGDILIPRVGSRCLTREARVAAGAGVFSDSVYRLRGAQDVMERVWATMASDFGRQWRAARSVGSCAKHLPLWVLRDMPVL